MRDEVQELRDFGLKAMGLFGHVGVCVRVEKEKAQQIVSSAKLRLIRGVAGDFKPLMPNLRLKYGF